MARTLALVGKIGPAFNGAEVHAYGKAFMPIEAENFESGWEEWVGRSVKELRTQTIDMLFNVIADNMDTGYQYRYDTAPDSTYSLHPLMGE